MEAVLFVIVGVAVVGGVVVYAQRAHARWQADCADLPDVLDTSSLMSLTLRTRPPLRAADVRAAGGGKNDPPVWRVTSSSQVGARTTLSLSREGTAGALRERLGVKDVHTGDAAFDAAYTIRGSEADVVRGILAAQSARDAVRAFFAVGGATGCSIDDAGAASARFQRSATSPANARACALALVRLLDALDAVKDAPARAELDGVSSVGGASGSPVRVPSA